MYFFRETRTVSCRILKNSRITVTLGAALGNYRILLHRRQDTCLRVRTDQSLTARSRIFTPRHATSFPVAPPGVSRDSRATDRYRKSIARKHSIHCQKGPSRFLFLYPSFPYSRVPRHARGGRSLRDLGEPLDREKRIDRSPQKRT